MTSKLRMSAGSGKVISMVEGISSSAKSNEEKKGTLGNHCGKVGNNGEKSKRAYLSEHGFEPH